MEYDWNRFENDEKLVNGSPWERMIHLLKLKDVGTKDLTADDECLLGRLFAKWINDKVSYKL